MMSNGALAPGGVSNAGAQKSYLGLIKRANIALGKMTKTKKQMDKQRIRAVKREARGQKRMGLIRSRGLYCERVRLR